jgi:hypothetical protein
MKEIIDVLQPLSGSSGPVLFCLKFIKSTKEKALKIYQLFLFGLIFNVPLFQYFMEFM